MTRQILIAVACAGLALGQANRGGTSKGPVTRAIDAGRKSQPAPKQTQKPAPQGRGWVIINPGGPGPQSGTGPELPGACAAGEHFVKLDAGGSRTFYLCAVANEWMPIIGESVRVEKHTIPHTALTAAAATQAVPLFELPANAKVLGVTIRHSVAFAGPGITGFTVSLGRAASGTEADYGGPQDVHQPASASTFHDEGGHWSMTMEAHEVAAHFTAAGANLGNGTATHLTAGSLTVWVRYTVLE